MPASLSPAQVAQYRHDGFLFPVDCLTPDEVGHYRAHLEEFEREQGDTFGKLPDLVLFTPQGAQDQLPTHVRTPDGNELPIFGDELVAEIGRRYGAPVEMIQLRHGIFDQASISVIALDTIEEIGRLAGIELDVRRFRPNIVIRSLRPFPFQEDEWVGGTLSFGDEPDAARRMAPPLAFDAGNTALIEYVVGPFPVACSRGIRHAVQFSRVGELRDRARPIDRAGHDLHVSALRKQRLSRR